MGNWTVANFISVQALIIAIMKLADAQDHHPTVTFDYKTIKVETMTHDTGSKITDKDIKLARGISQLMGE